LDGAATRLLRDRDTIYGDVFARRVKGLGMREILIAPRAPWQNPFAERVIGSIRRECLNHVIVINERHRCRSSCVPSPPVFSTEPFPAAVQARRLGPHPETMWSSGASAKFVTGTGISQAT
jgi:hypothetical protein